MPAGDTPDNIRNHPALKGVNIPKTGQPGTSGVGLMVTKTLVVMGDSQVTTTPEHPRGAMLRAYDKSNGREVGAVWMPAPQSGSPRVTSHAARRLVGLGLTEIRVQKFGTPVLWRLQDRSAPFLRPIDDPVLELPGNVAHNVAAYRIYLTVRFRVPRCKFLIYLASLITASWNQIIEWLKRVETLREHVQTGAG